MSHDILSPKLMILASAGSGKTFQLGNRVIGLVGARGIDPERIVALTFTRKAAGEFADSVLSKLALCSLDSREAEKLHRQIGEEFPVAPVLASVVAALPRFQLGTMDGFFSKVVRGFQYELGLTGGTFELIEGPRLVAAMEDILAGVLGDALDEDGAEEFLHAFRRATLGREGQGVLRDVEAFLKTWHGWWKAGVPFSGWGGESVFGNLPSADSWEKEKGGRLSKLASLETNPAMFDLIEAFERHTIGSGRVKDLGKTLFERVLEQVPGTGLMEFDFNRKRIRLSAESSRDWRELYGFLAECELAAAVSRTRAVADLVSRLDGECERRLRRRGLLGFDDVKVLLGRWARSEDARLMREAVDFRLDSRFDHWLLDEFQDTSRAEWQGIVPLLDEVVSREDGSLFVVGDRKQAIYGWRGGDVSLFDVVERRYNADGGMEVVDMPESWRSCPAVLDLVNTVCGNLPLIEELFGVMTARSWRWADHVSAKSQVTGEAQVEYVQKDDRDSHLVGLLERLGVGRRALTCGVLVRSNTQVREIAAMLREHGFDVIEEGRREPVKDHVVGVALNHLVRWLADPADAFAREVVVMSPLRAVLEMRFEGVWQREWEGLLQQAREMGFAGMVESLVAPLWPLMSEFSRRRAGDVVAALAEFDAGPPGGAREAARWLEGLEISQSPGMAAVQVMTIHKSKGLGFDVVILPEVDDGQVPSLSRFGVATGESAKGPWLLQTPPGWVRSLVPTLMKAEQEWIDAQRYEELCVLYVALTRAKRGLYVFLPPVPKNRKDAHGWVSPANLIARSAGAVAGEVIFQSGDSAWYQSVVDRETREEEQVVKLGVAVKKRPRISPSGEKKSSGGSVSHSTSGMKFGNEVHAIFEKMEWLDEGLPELPISDAASKVRAVLAVPQVRDCFLKRGRNIEVYREQGLEVLVGGDWLSGVIDRLHVHRDAKGRVTLLEVIDFKTDAVEQAEQLHERYAAQMKAYQRALAVIYPEVEIQCRLVSTALGEIVTA